MTRIAVISQLPPPIHGSTVMTRTFLQSLESLGHEWRLLDRRFSTSVGDVGKFRLRKVVSAAWLPVRLVGMLLCFRPAIFVFFATNRTLSFLVDWVLSELLRGFKVPQINYLHTLGFEALATRNRVFAWMVKRLLRSADITVCLGPTLAKDITRWVQESRIVYIPNTVAEQPADLGEREPRATPLVLYLSNLIPEKGADVFVDLAIELATELPDATFIVAGATADQRFTDSLVAKATNAGLGSRVQFPGAITDQAQKWCLLLEASVLVFPSTYPFEAQPLTILEALSVGTPVIAYDVGGIRDVLQDSTSGVTVPCGNFAELVANTLAITTSRTVPQHIASRLACRHDGSALAEYESAWRRVLIEASA